ncbi:hypothetical protein Zm00014a_042714, partial [Zea mays]
NCGIVITIVYCSILKTVIFKNFVPKQGLKVVVIDQTIQQHSQYRPVKLQHSIGQTD